MRTRAEKLDLNTSYTNTHTAVEKILPGAGNRTRIEAFTPHQVCLSFGALHHSAILPTVILFFFTEVYNTGAGIEPAVGLQSTRSLRPGALPTRPSWSRSAYVLKNTHTHTHTHTQYSPSYNYYKCLSRNTCILFC